MDKTQHCPLCEGYARERDEARAEVETLRDWRSTVEAAPAAAQVIVQARMTASTMMEPAIKAWRDHSAKIESERDQTRAALANLQKAAQGLIYAHFEKPGEFGAYLAGEDLAWSNVDAWRNLRIALAEAQSIGPHGDGTP